MLEPRCRLLKAQLLISEMTNKLRGYEVANYPISRTLSPLLCGVVTYPLSSVIEVSFEVEVLSHIKVMLQAIMKLCNI